MSELITGKKILIIMLIAIILTLAITPSPSYAFDFRVDEDQLSELSGNDATEVEELEKEKVGSLEKKIVELSIGIIEHLNRFLGLRSLDELIFNREIPILAQMIDTDVETEEDIETEEEEEGWVRYRGVLPETWYKYSKSLHLVFQAIAWSLLTVSIVKNLLQINLATINPMIRRRFYDAVRDLFLTGFLLVSTLLIIETLFLVNERMVEIFRTMLPTGSFATMSYSNGTFAGVLIHLFYFFIGLRLNFMYIIRAINVAILVASAPLFAISISFEGKNMLFAKWARELVSNIFLQTIHAFALSFLLSIQLSASGFENLVIAFALIPITEFFRGLILGDGASSTGFMSGAALTGAAGVATGLAKGGADMLEGNKRSGEKSKDSKGGDSENYQYKDNNYDSSSYSGESDKTNTTGMDNATSSETLATMGDSRSPSNESAFEKYTNIEDAKARSEAEGVEFDAGAYQEQASSTQGETQSDPYAEMQNSKYYKGGPSGADPKNVLKSAGKIAGGAAFAFAGAGISAATEGKSGRELIEKGGAVSTGGFHGAFGEVKKVANRADYNVTNKETGGNIISAKENRNGNIEIKRDRAKVSDDGLVSVGSTNNHKYHTFTYDPSVMNDSNKSRLDNIVENYSNNPNKTELREQYGIEDLSVNNNGQVKIKANQEYLDKMGIESMRQDKRQYIEEKGMNQPKQTQIVPDINFKSTANQPNHMQEQDARPGVEE